MHGYHRDLTVLTHSFPTRRASDLTDSRHCKKYVRWYRPVKSTPEQSLNLCCLPTPLPTQLVLWIEFLGCLLLLRQDWLARLYRSEEHTSELQSLMRISYAVFCLKKKNTKK